MRWAEINGNDLFSSCRTDFDAAALSLYRYQYDANALYRQYNELLHINPERVLTTEQIPYLPISFFKTHRVWSGPVLPEQLLFESSGTTGMIPSRHYVKDAALYEASLLEGFRHFYGNPDTYTYLGLLPSYLERSTSSLVHMARVLMAQSRKPDNGFYLDEWEVLETRLLDLEARGEKALLLGVTFALLDFAAAYPMKLQGVKIMETGGMKGRREEWTRDQVHDFLKQQWQAGHIHAEYGMTELLSQAYSQGGGLFEPAPTMSVRVRDLQDPLEVRRQGRGALNIIDLANVHSCAFIATEDVGHCYSDGRFEVLGRMDHAALRGCSLMRV